MEATDFVLWVFGGVGVAYTVIIWAYVLITGAVWYVTDGETHLGKYVGADGAMGGFLGVCGVVLPVAYMFFVDVLRTLTKAAGWFPLVLILIGLCVFVGLYLMRGIVRLKKDLTNHKADKEAHGH